MNQLLNEFIDEYKKLLNAYYPKVYDTEFGGFLSNFSYNWVQQENQEKMIVSQARHIWALSKSGQFLENKEFIQAAKKGFEFLFTHFLDKKYGGCFQIRERNGSFSQVENWQNEKRAYGNAFAIYGLSALYSATHEDTILKMAQSLFNWLEEVSFDPEYGGYFQFLTEDNSVFDRQSEYKSLATDSIEVGYKDQNSSIHILEAYTELYHIWKDEKLAKQLERLLILIRDKIVNPKGYLQLFFKPDWTPVLYNNLSQDEFKYGHHLDHVSFGHDYETAFLMLEASYTLKIHEDYKTLLVAKQLADHAIKNGWDAENGGFYDEGFYTSENKCEIILDTKNWWAQAEALNIYLLLYLIFDEEKYLSIFQKEWDYIKKYLIDPINGDWYWGSLEKEPEQLTGDKSRIWKCTYHNSRALMNCITMLSIINGNMPIKTRGFIDKLNETINFIDYWKDISKNL